MDIIVGGKDFMLSFSKHPRKCPPVRSLQIKKEHPHSYVLGDDPVKLLVELVVVVGNHQLGDKVLSGHLGHVTWL